MNPDIFVWILLSNLGNIVRNPKLCPCGRGLAPAVQVALTICYRLGVFENRNSFLTVLKTRESKSKVPEGSVSGEDSLLGWQTATWPFLVCAGGEREEASSREGLTHMSSFNQITTQWPNTITLRVRSSTYIYFNPSHSLKCYSQRTWMRAESSKRNINIPMDILLERAAYGTETERTGSLLSRIQRETDWGL